MDPAHRDIAASAARLAILIGACVAALVGCGGARARGTDAASDGANDAATDRGDIGGAPAEGGTGGAGGSGGRGGAAGPDTGGTGAGTGGAGVGGVPGTGGRGGAGGGSAGTGGGGSAGTGRGGSAGTGGGGTAGTGGGCVPSCENRQCGRDGCGNVCGRCETGTTCLTSYVCRPDCDFMFTIVGRNGSRRMVSGSGVNGGSCQALASNPGLLWIAIQPGGDGATSFNLVWGETSPQPGAVIRFVGGQSQAPTLSLVLSGPGTPDDLAGGYVAAFAPTDVTVRFIEFDYRVGGAFRVQIDSGGVIADPIGDAVEVSGEMFGKFR